MGSDYYARTAIGVKANKYAKEKKIKYQIQKSFTEGYGNDKKIIMVFDANSNPVMESYTANYIEFMGKNFISNHERNLVKNSEIKFEDTSFYTYIARKGLNWFSYDYNQIYDGDIIGLQITEDSSNQQGITLDKLPELFAEAKKLLESIGITDELRLYSSFYHSY